mgnify:CR=1 FL=1
MVGVVALVHVLRTGNPLLGLTKRRILYLTLVLAVGPGLIVNVILKDQWGRARPLMIEEFGGDKEFTPAFVVAGQGRNNGSFNSGHAAGAFFLVSIGYVAGRRRRTVFLAAGTYAVIVGFVRIFQGRHFLSDVVFSFLIVYATARVLAALLLPHDE